MGYYVKRIVTIKQDSSKEKLEKLEHEFEDITDFNLKIYSDHLDDSNWNFGDGISGIFDDVVWEEVSRRCPEIEFTVHTVSETNIIVDYHCYNGRCEEFIFHQSEEWYEANKDGYEKNHGIRPGYFTDYGLGGDYPVMYGDEHIPAGVDWTELPENKIDKEKLEKFNVNRTAEVILTKRGAEVLNKYFGRVSAKTYAENDTYSAELWLIMEIFGKEFRDFSGDGPLFKNNCISINGKE